MCLWVSKLCLRDSNIVYKSFHNLEEPYSERKMHWVWWKSVQFVDLNRFPPLGKGRWLDGFAHLGKTMWQQKDKAETGWGLTEQREQSSENGWKILLFLSKKAFLWSSFWICCLGEIALIFCWTSNKVWEISHDSDRWYSMS